MHSDTKFSIHLAKSPSRFFVLKLSVFRGLIEASGDLTHDLVAPLSSFNESPCANFSTDYEDRSECKGPKLHETYFSLRNLQSRDELTGLQSTRRFPIDLSSP